MFVLLSALGAALAAPYGNPTRYAEDTLLSVQTGVSTSGRLLAVEGCTSERCDSWDQTQRGGLRVNVRPVDALGLWVEAGWAKQALDGSGHNGNGPAGAAGLFIALPESGRLVRPALGLRGDYLRTRVAPDEADGSLPRSEAWTMNVDAAALAGFGRVQGQAMGWVGVNGSIWDDRQLAVNTDNVNISLRRAVPISVVAGGELLSEPLSAPWESRSPRLSAGLEVEGIGTWGMAAWVGMAW